MPIKANLLLTFILKDPVQYYDMDMAVEVDLDVD